MGAILGFFTSPLGKYFLIALVVLAIIGGYTWKVYSAGEAHIQAKWDQANLAKKKKSDEVTTKTEIQYVDRIKVIKEKGATITKYVTKYVTKEDDAKCVIPNNAVLLLDDAALGVVPPAPKDEPSAVKESQ